MEHNTIEYIIIFILVSLVFGWMIWDSYKSGVEADEWRKTYKENNKIVKFSTMYIDIIGLLDKLPLDSYELKEIVPSPTRKDIAMSYEKVRGGWSDTYVYSLKYWKPKLSDKQMEILKLYGQIEELT